MISCDLEQEVKPVELDHIFIRASYGAPEAELLRAFGLTADSGNRHPGQGTENRRFFFHNGFIELLWICDAAEVSSESTRRTMLEERLRCDDDNPASPFGICFRPSTAQQGAPFPHWQYRPDYLADGMTIDIGVAGLSEPMWFYLDKASAPSAAPVARRQPIDHPAGLRDITSVTVTRPAGCLPSSAARAAEATGVIAMRSGPAQLMEICFDHAAQGGHHDFRPTLPLLITY
jgi:hypothetical protein